MTIQEKNNTAGYIAGAASYIIWGALPLYWKAVSGVSPLEILAHRILWSFVFLAIIDLIRSRGQSFRMILRMKTFLAVLLTGSLIAINWFVYIYSVNSGFIVQASLGYYINPIVSVLFGVVFLKERFNTAKKAALACAVCGVLFMAVSLGEFPWISITLAVSFGLYGLLKKVFAFDSVGSLLMETMLLLPPSLFIIIGSGAGGTGHLFTGSAQVTIMLLLAGVVTSIPLLLFSEGAKRIPLSAMGFLQYCSPTLSLLIGVFFYGEPFTFRHIAAFTFIWSGLAVYTASLFYKRSSAEPDGAR